jgi:dephospho-CoA kinase
MKKSIFITAVTGTGKSTVCKALCAQGYDSVDLESVDGLYELVDEKTGQALPGDLDQISEGVDWNCNKAKLKILIQSQKSQLAFYCGGMSNTDDVWELFDVVVMLTVSDETTVKRLSTRQTGEFGSTQANRDWVLSWKHSLEDRWMEKGCIKIDAEADPDKVAAVVVDAVAKEARSSID